ncbi:MAG: hypothetical protein WAP74_02765 [Patescibacteria group bacterium]
MDTLNAMTFEGFLVPVGLMLAILVAPSATAFFLLGHFLKWGKSEAGALFALGLFVDLVIRYGYGRSTLLGIFNALKPRPRPQPDEKTKAAQATVEFEKRKSEAGGETPTDARAGEVMVQAIPDK